MPPSVDFFFYGTLRDEEVRRAVLGPAAKAPVITEGRVAGYRCAPVDAGAFPALVAEAGAEAEGILVQGVDLTAAARISLFEGEGYDYQPAPIPVVCEADELPGWVYLPTGRLAVRAGIWKIEEWRARHKTAFLANARRAMASIDARTLERYRIEWFKRITAPGR